MGMAAEQSVLDTRTKPYPDKTADELWFDLRVYSQYGSMWERCEDSVALSMERAINTPLPANDDVRSALRLIQGGVARPRIDHFDVPAWFKYDHLGTPASGDNYWRTQETFPVANQQRDKAYAKMLKNLEKARQAAIVSRTRSA